MNIPRFLIPSLAFAGGTICGLLLDQRKEKTSASPKEPAATTSTSSSPLRMEPTREAAASPKAATEPARRDELRISSRTIDALLAGGDQRRMFSRMDLSEEQIKSIGRIRMESMENLKELEKRHAKVVSRDGKDYVQVDWFPAERAAWLENISLSIRKEIHDDRAEIVSRLIAAADNDEQAGTTRREIHVSSPATDGKLRIEEKSFDASGRHIDSDFEVVDSSSKSRWGHLLDFEPPE